MIEDTVSIYLRNTSSPYSIIDSAKGLLDSNGRGSFPFNSAVNGINYYIVIKHRNSIETWSGSGVNFISNRLIYNFTTTSSQAYGNNLIQKGSKFCIYSGDVNQDGAIDASDISLVENAAVVSLTGYVNADMNGDEFVDASDLSIVDNNAFNGVLVIRP